MKTLLNNLILFLFFSYPIFSFSQELYVPISDPYIVKIYNEGNKDSFRNYVSNDSLGNKIISGKFDGMIPIGKWEIFFDNNRKRAIYSYKNGKLNGEFIEYYWNGTIKSKESYLNNKPSLTWQSFYPDQTLESNGEMYMGNRFKEWNDKLYNLGYEDAKENKKELDNFFNN